MNKYQWITADQLMAYIKHRQPDGKHNHIINIVQGYCEMMEMEKAIFEPKANTTA